jgi:hypothetical protein
MGAIEEIRQGVTEAGRARRSAWSAPVDGPWVAGNQMLLLGIDPTLQGQHDAGRAILHRMPGALVVIPMDMAWAQRVGQLREIQTLLGFRREDRWDALATVLEVRADAPEAELVVQLGAIWVHDQLLLEEHEQVPGLDAAMKRLDTLQAGIVVTHATPKPDALLPLLFRILDTHHWRAFVDLFDHNATQSDKKVAFDQFRHAWETAQGQVTFDGYDEPQLFVDEAVEGTVVRTRLKRVGEKGEALSRPVKWVKRGAGWRLAGGLM